MKRDKEKGRRSGEQGSCRERVGGTKKNQIEKKNQKKQEKSNGPKSSKMNSKGPKTVRENRGIIVRMSNIHNN